MSKIVFKTVVGHAGLWFGTLITSGIQNEDGSPLKVQKALYVKFLAPPNTNKIQLKALFDPWQEVTDAIRYEPVDDKSVEVTAEILIADPYTFKHRDTFTWEISGDLTGDVSLYTGSFILYADELPSGTVAV